MKIGLLSAPSILGLRPPAPTSVPGCAKAPEALREAGLYRRCGPRSLRNQVAIIEHARLSPYFSPEDTVHAGCRDDDEGLNEVTALLGAVLPAAQIRQLRVEQAARKILDVTDRAGLDGYWIHLDVDILDPSVMPAVDGPDPGGLGAAELTGLLADLAPRAAGAHVTVFDPDLDPDGSHALLLANIIVEGLGPLGRDRRYSSTERNASSRAASA